MSDLAEALVQLRRTSQTTALLAALQARLNAPIPEAGIELLKEFTSLQRTSRRLLRAWQKLYAQDPLAEHLFETRRQFRQSEKQRPQKSGRALQTILLLSHQQAVDLGFKGRGEEWEQLVRLAPAQPGSSA